uniref:GIY-YIG endonuclease n=1 Tax=Ophiognomonia clavigignenti-juglandacearum TaxID=218668 RepID=A0A2C9DSE5_9PEZI|nr:GIY-YIG endonuclease [Ophiognomonia clavigignenti-juglandacearum]
MFSTSKGDDSSSTDSTGLAVFYDADKDKLNILKYIKGKSGIYMWTNKLNDKKYVGSSVDLRRRLLEYYNVNRLLTEKSMPIYVALLKYGYHNFTLTILDFCDMDSLMSREKYFFEVYSPEYNILKTPGSPDRGSGWKHSEATIENMRVAANKRSESSEFLAKLSKGQSSGIKVEVIDTKTNTSTTYHAIKAAARALDIDKRYIEHYIYLKQEKPVLGRYIFKLVNFNSDKQITNLVNYEKIQKTSIKVEVTNVDTKKVIIYSSIGAAAKALGYRQPSISLYIKENRTKPFKGKYLFKLVN